MENNNNNPIERGQKAYEAEVSKHPLYCDGAERPRWNELSEIARWSWTRPAAYQIAKEVFERKVA